MSEQRPSDLYPNITPEAKAIFDHWTSMDCFIFAKRYPDPWIEHARKDIPNLIAWLATEQEMHAAWRKRAEDAEAELDPSVCRLQFPDGSVPSNAREAAEGWKKWYDKLRLEAGDLRQELAVLASEDQTE
jgi:hypothetical protein